MKFTEEVIILERSGYELYWKGDNFKKSWKFVNCTKEVIILNGSGYELYWISNNIKKEVVMNFITEKVIILKIMKIMWIVLKKL